MGSLAQWLKPPRTLLLSLVVLTLVSVSALAYFGWRLLEQERLAGAQRAHERLEQQADRIAASHRRTLAELGDLLGGLNSTLPEEAPVADGVLLLLRDESVLVAPAGRLLYYPSPSPEPEASPGIFADGEMFEFIQGEPGEALRIYQRLERSGNTAVRAGALLRMARILHRLGREDECRKLYRELARIETARVAGVPAPLIAFHALADLPGSAADIERFTSQLVERRWRLTRGQFAFYSAEASRLSRREIQPPADAALLSEAVRAVWQGRARHGDGQTQETLWVHGQPLFVMWRGTLEQRAVLVAPPAAYIKKTLSLDGVRCALVDGDGRLLAGRKSSGRSALRTAAEAQLPWTLYVSASQTAEQTNLVLQQRFLLLGIAVMVLFLIAGTYFIARAIRRESQVLRMQSEFVSAVSHEFRSPLTSLRQLSEMLAFGRLPSEDRRQLYYDTLVRETTRLQRMVEALLNFGRMEAGARRYRFETLDAAVLVRRVIDDFEEQWPDSVPRIQYDAAPEPCPIRADPEAIGVAVRNLLDNALKYSPQRPVVWVACGPEKEHIAIRVRDEGLGVADAEKKAIFRKFFRGSAASAGNVKGSGIGLAMVRHIAQAHGGEVTVISKAGQGSTFALILPAAEAPWH